MYNHNSPKPIALSLFSGAGGMDLGVAQAGFEILASIEQDPYCCETLRLAVELENFQTKVIEKDIQTVDPQKLMNQLSLHCGELDLLFGGPPCQSFSQIGKKRGLEDPRGLLLFQMLRFAKVFKPKFILIEQVKGLLSARSKSGEKGAIFRELLAELNCLNYLPEWKVINAASYGIPQLRERLFIVATKDVNRLTFPEPTHSPEIQLPLLNYLKPYVTVGEVITGLGEPALKNGNGNSQRKDSHVDPTPNGDRYRINGVPEGSYLAAQTHKLPPEQIKGLTKKDTTKFLRTSRFQPCKTLRGGEIFFHPIENRYLTPREYMRIHGFPDSYLLKGPIRGRSGRVCHLDQYRQIANSVPPPVAKKLAQEIYHSLRCQKYLNCSVIP
jgi:DNA (cytosine-5)-methyltransferase 1